MEDTVTPSCKAKPMAKPKKELTPVVRALKTKERVGRCDATKARAAQAATTQAREEAKVKRDLKQRWEKKTICSSGPSK
jgi:hypothetical protein